MYGISFYTSNIISIFLYEEKIEIKSQLKPNHLLLTGEFVFNDKNVLISKNPYEIEDISSDKAAKTFHFTITATDSGNLESLPIYLEVVILKESKYPPVLISQKIQIMTTEGLFKYKLISSIIKGFYYNNQHIYTKIYQYFTQTQLLFIKRSLFY